MMIYRPEFVHNSFPHVMSLKEEYFPLGVRSISVYTVRGESFMRMSVEASNQ